MEDISKIAWKLGIAENEIITVGKGKAKITWEALKSRMKKPQGSLILVTSVNPTPFGEGKTCLLYTSPSPRDKRQSRMPSSA